MIPNTSKRAHSLTLSHSSEELNIDRSQPEKRPRFEIDTASSLLEMPSNKGVRGLTHSLSSLNVLEDDEGEGYSLLLKQHYVVLKIELYHLLKARKTRRREGG